MHYLCFIKESKKNSKKHYVILISNFKKNISIKKHIAKIYYHYPKIYRQVSLNT